MSVETFIDPWRAGQSPAHRRRLRHLADSMAAAAGFTRCAVRVGRTDEMCEVMAVHGDSRDLDGSPFSVGKAVRNAEMKRLVGVGDAYGPLFFIPSERRAGAPAQRPDDQVGPWQDGDLLIALVQEESGRVRGSVILDAPGDGLRPSPERLGELSDVLRVLLGGLLGLIEHEEVSHQLDVAMRMRETMREIDHRTSIEELLEGVRRQMRLAFRADELLLHLDADPDFPEVADVRLPGALRHELRTLICEAWAHDEVIVIEDGVVRDNGPLGNVQPLLALMAERRLGTAVLVPVGVADRCIGVLTAVRTVGGPRWTAVESRAAVEVGRDLGRAVLNAGSHAREARVMRELEKLQQYRSQMVSTISHELKNPIGVIQGHLEMIEEADSQMAPLADRALDGIARGATRLAELADHLLVLSRVADVELPMEQQQVDLAALVRDAVDFARVTAERSGVAVLHETPGPVRVVGDAEALRLVVSNLLSNAIKYSNPGDTVQIDLAAAGGEVVLTCADTGLGISEEDQKRLFSEFFRSTNPDAHGRPGTGLGLVIVQRVVSRHGGTISLSSQLNQGTTVKVTLPEAPGDVSEG